MNIYILLKHEYITFDMINRLDKLINISLCVLNFESIRAQTLFILKQYIKKIIFYIFLLYK